MAIDTLRDFKGPRCLQMRLSAVEFCGWVAQHYLWLTFHDFFPFSFTRQTQSLQKGSFQKSNFFTLNLLLMFVPKLDKRYVSINVNANVNKGQMMILIRSNANLTLTWLYMKVNERFIVYKRTVFFKSKNSYDNI